MSLAAFTDLPKQKVSEDEKTDSWAIDCIDGFIGLSTFNRSYLSDRYMEDMYEYYNGEIDDSEYTHVTQPFGKSRKEFPAKIHNYNIIKPVVDRLLGEKAKRGLNYSVINTNPEAVNGRKIAKKQFLRDLGKKYFMQELQQAGFPVDEDLDQIPELDSEKVNQMFEDSYVDEKSIMGQNALDYLTRKLEMEDKFVDCFKDFVISGFAASHRGVNDDEVYWERANPMDVDGDKDPSVEFWEDGDWAAYRKMSFPSAVVDFYYDDLNSDEIERLENPQGHYSSDFISRSSDVGALTEPQASYERQERAIEVVRVYWKSRKKVGFVETTDEYGFKQTKIVEEGYQPAMGENVEWHWVNEVWEGHRIDEDIYVRMRPYPDQRWSLDNPSKCKLPINGVKHSDDNSNATSLVMMGIPYQLSYNIYKYRLELAIAKAKDRVGQFDINMIPKKWDPEDFLYWVESTGIAWVDYDKENMQLSPQHQSVMDLTIQTIDKYIALLQSVQQEWERLSGVNAERAGSVDPRQGKGVTEQAIYQGSLVTEDMFRRFRRFEQRELQAVLDYSKNAWRDGKKAQYIMPTGAAAQLDIDGEDFMESEFGVWVSNDPDDLRNLDLLKQSAQAMIQNGASLSDVATVIRSNNFSQIEKKLEEAEEARAEQQKALKELEMKEKQQERDHEMAKEQAETQRTQMEIEADLQQTRMENEAKKEVATINDEDDS